MKVKEIMTKETVQYCTPETRLPNAAKVMKTANIGALPVLNDEKQVIGIVTDRDICLSLASKTSKDPSRVTIGEVMTKKVATASADEELSAALRRMRAKKIGRLPVVDNTGKLKGVVSLHNLLARTTGRKKALAGIDADGDEILKTVQAITGRYAGKISEARKTAKAPMESSAPWEEDYD